MVGRLCNPSKKQSFFLFGPRGVGKTTLINTLFIEGNPSWEKSTIYLNLLEPELESRLLQNPSYLKDLIKGLDGVQKVIIDEVQKVPSLLDVVHDLIEKNKKLQFILSGSSARKLKRGAANLLAGRAFSYHLHPLTCDEYHQLGPNILDLLSYGSLPKIFDFEDAEDKKKFLKSYVHTYLKEEIQAEQIVRNMTSFRQFLEFAGQSNCEPLVFSNISRQSGVDDKSIARFYEILQDTLLGRFLEPYSKSVRERQKSKPKFYFFDTGVQRVLSHTIDIPLISKTYEYGNLFEQFIINEIFRKGEYSEKDYLYHYIRTKNDVEIDLILTPPGKKPFLIEIKSTNKVIEDHWKSLVSLGKDIPHQEKIIICQEERPRQTEEGVHILPWQEALKILFR